MALSANYQCPDCGATNISTPDQCCDECILKFYFENVNASNFGDWREPESPAEDNCDHEWGVEKDQPFCLKCMKSEAF